MKDCIEKSNENMIYTKLQSIREKLVQINATKEIDFTTLGLPFS